MSNPVAIVVTLLGLYLAILGFRDRQGNLISAFTGKPFGGAQAGSVGGTVTPQTPAEQHRTATTGDGKTPVYHGL